MRVIKTTLPMLCLLSIVGCSKATSSAPAVSPGSPAVTATQPATPAAARGQDTNSPGEPERDLGTFDK
jgi:hypothetical protein